MSLNDDTRRSIEIGCHIPELRAEIARLKKELVDGMNALAASQAEIERLRKALERTQGFIRQIFGPKYDKEISDLALSSGTLVPCSDGGVQIDWPTAEMTFRPDGSQEFDDVCAAAFKELADRHKAIFGREIAEERSIQDEEWGGPAHDDSHDETDWIPIIAKFLRRADVAANFIGA